MQLPREYIQLHRDTTVYNLTSSPNIVNGILIYEDSPLVKAVKEGSILVIDEVDKAPTHVTSILKSLIEDNEMVLADGRRIVSAASAASVDHADIIIHSSFRMICLANRPGYPFLGNDFFREIGDVFACHCIDNPDPKSELDLLLNYAPGIPKGILEKLVASFNDLRNLVEKGIINYPYSTRELVNVVKHLQVNSSDGISRALQNVFDFDVEPDMREIIREVMNKNGIPTNMESIFKVELGEEFPLPEASLIESWLIGNPDSNLEISSSLQEMLVRGTWPIQIPKKWETLDQINGRSTVFSEWLYSFKLFSPGASSSDIILGSDMFLYAISSAPVKLLVISPDHRTQKTVPLYEFIPSTKITKLKLFEVGVGKIAIHNSQEHSFVVIDLLAGTISTILAKGLDPVHESFCTSKVAGYQFLFQTQSSSLVLFDLINLIQATFSVNKAGIQGLRHVQNVGNDRWFLQDSKGNKFFGHLNVSKGQVTLLLQQISTTDTYKATEPNFISNLKVIGDDSIWANSSPPDCLGGFLKITEKLNSANTEVWSLLGWPRQLSNNLTQVGNVTISSSILAQTQQYVNVIPVIDMGAPRGVLELVNPSSKRLVRINVPIQVPSVDLSSTKLTASNLFGTPKPELMESVKKIVELPKGHLLLLSHFGECLVFQCIMEKNEAEMKKWRELTGSLDDDSLLISYQGADPDIFESILGSSSKGGNKGSNDESHSASDKDGEGGVGSGSGGPGKGYSNEARDSGKIDDSFTLREIGEVSKITDSQREIHHIQIKEKLKYLNMSDKDYNTFTRYKRNVEKEIRELRAILEAVEAKSKERIWRKNQISGDIDDDKLVGGLAGERAIYRTRGENDDEFFQANPKQMYFVFDLSASMMRFNGHDGRMDRSLECALMIMEAFKGFEHKFSYKLIGHSGDGPALQLNPSAAFPKNEKDIFDILHRMQSHASYTMSGDNTLAAISNAIKSVTAEEGDDYFVLVLSDANLHQYNISPSILKTEMQADSRVNCFMIFIGNISNQASRISDGLNGQSFNCFDNADLPKIMKSIFLKAMLK